MERRKRGHNRQRHAGDMKKKLGQDAAHILGMTVK
jgi:hypothetical protein